MTISEKSAQGPLPSVLILGARGGIGAACANIFSDKFEIHRVSRTAGDLCGDLKDQGFRNQVVEKFNPNVIIVTYGDWPTKEESISSIFNLFLNSVIDIFEQFEKKGGVDYFVVVSSISAQASGSPMMARENFIYNTVKRCLSDFFTQAQLHMKFRMKIILVEPGMVMTDFANINERMKTRSSDDILTRANILPMTAEAVALAIYENVCSSEQRSRTIILHNKHKPGLS